MDQLNPTIIIRALTGAALAGLLLAVGLRLTWAEVLAALRRCRLSLVLLINFALVPVITLALGSAFHVERDLLLGMMLLAAAPFAPVVPVFTRMARGDLALAAGLTSLFPFLSAIFTPLVFVLCLKFIPDAETMNFNFMTVLGVLVATITLPLGLGVALNQAQPNLARKLLRPVEVFSEVIGALSLAYVAAVEFKSVLATGWLPLTVMVLVFELSLLAGYWAGGGERNSRRALALGSCNRNIALAVLVAISSFPGTPVIGAVVANGLLAIFLGLLHVAWWRFRHDLRTHN